MPDRFVEALENQTTALNKLTAAFERSHRTGRRISWLMVVVVAIGIVLLFGVFSIRATQSDAHKSLNIIQSATSPQSQQKAQRQTGQAVAMIIQCTDNHTDRVVAALEHFAVPAREAGCPPDHLPGG